MDWIATVNLLAIILGPILAVIITRLMDNRSAERARQYQVFRDLMRTRAAKISPAHVEALNLVEIEFQGISKVRDAWQRYLENLSATVPADSAAQSNFFLRRDQLFIKLVQEVANGAGLKSVDITDAITNNYYPMGWNNEQQEQEQARRLLIAVMSGTKSISVKIQDDTKWSGPFPPLIGTAPTVKSAKEQAE